MRDLMKTTLALLLLLPMHPALTAELRTFTSTDGRTVEAEILAAAPDNVTLKLATGQTVVSPLNRFSEADQKHIADWLKQNPVKLNHSFQVSYTKDKTGSSKSRNGSVTVTSETWVCKIKVANRSGQALENVELDYTVFYHQNDEGKQIFEWASQGMEGKTGTAAGTRGSLSAP
jgi:hypothetical protein